MGTQRPSLLAIYGRNIEHQAFRRGWTAAQLARKLNVTPTSLNRVRLMRGRYIDPELLEAFLHLFKCEPNDLLLAQDGLDYPITPDSD